MPYAIELRRVSLAKWYNPFSWGKYKVEWRYCEDPPSPNDQSRWYQSERPDADVIYQHTKIVSKGKD
jgi:hypothetical protein